MSSIRIILADDHAILRTGLRMLIESHSDLRVVGEAGDFQTTLDLVTRDPVDVLILDLTMPGVSGMGAIERVRQLCPRTRVIILTMHDDPAYARSAMAMGAAGYLVKSVADSELVNTIRSVHRGGMYVHVGSETREVDSLPAGGTSPVMRLSEREREVFEQVALGHTSAAIAERLGVSVKTVESYRARLMQKLGLHNRADLTRLAIDIGVLVRNDDDAA